MVKTIYDLASLGIEEKITVWHGTCHIGNDNS